MLLTCRISHLCYVAITLIDKNKSIIYLPTAIVQTTTEELPRTLLKPYVTLSRGVDPGGWGVLTPENM